METGLLHLEESVDWGDFGAGWVGGYIALTTFDKADVLTT
jgi:hypothetical protein